MDHIIDGILITDLSGEILQANASWVRMFDCSAEVLRGADIGARYPGGLSELWSQAAATPGESFTAELALPRGRIGHGVVLAVNHTEETDGFFVQHWFGLICIVRDITREREIDKMKAGFISTVSHELRTPLTSILGFARMIQKKLDKQVLPHIEAPSTKTTRSIERIYQNLDIINKEGERLTSLINDMLDVAKMEAGKMEWRDVPVDLCEVIRRSARSIASLVEPKRLALSLALPEAPPPVRGDPDKLIQVLLNLLSNAVKFTKEGGIACRLWCEEGRAVVAQLDEAPWEVLLCINHGGNTHDKDVTRPRAELRLADIVTDEEDRRFYEDLY